MRSGIEQSPFLRISPPTFTDDKPSKQFLVLSKTDGNSVTFTELNKVDTQKCLNYNIKIFEK